MTKKYIGVADGAGLVWLYGERLDKFRDHIYREADKRPDGCYFEIDLTESQADIIRSLSGDSKAGLAACIAYGGISVPSDHEEVWKIISSDE